MSNPSITLRFAVREPNSGLSSTLYINFPRTCCPRVNLCAIAVFNKKNKVCKTFHTKLTQIQSPKSTKKSLQAKPQYLFMHSCLTTHRSKRTCSHQLLLTLNALSGRPAPYK